jgi:plastocyanin
MAVPRFLVAVPLLALGIYLPAAGAAPKPAPAATLGMVHEEFAAKSVTVACGDTLTMVNNSRFIHIVGAGRDGAVVDTDDVPVRGLHMMETNAVFQTYKWNTPGTFYLTCSVHPEMTVKVVVTKCG